jgi:hypothetical protein
VQPFTFSKPYDHREKVDAKTGKARKVTAYQAKAYDAVPDDVAKAAAEGGYGEVTAAPKADAKAQTSKPGQTTDHKAVDG